MNKRKKITIEHRLKQANSHLLNENKKVRDRNKALETRVIDLERSLEKALLHIEELQKFVFRGKKKKDENDKKKDGGSSSRKKANRSKESYRRTVPEESEITNEETHDIKNCPDCGTKLSKLKILEFYEEDIIPILEWYKRLRKITLKKITSGYCSHCKKRVSAIPIPKQKVSIGENIKEFVIFQITINQLSYSQVIDFADSYLNFKIASGEISKILEQQALKLKPAYEDLLKSIRASSGVHIDETSYNIAFPDTYSGNYAWVMTSMDEINRDSIFLLGKNRGGGNALDLIGEDYQGIGVSDDYGAYTNLFQKGKHALCWAHPLRKFRDLKDSKKLSKVKKKQATKVYTDFAKLFKKIEIVCKGDFSNEERIEKKEILMVKFQHILKPNDNDPYKMKTIKKTLLEKRDRYFVCITEPNIPLTNNKAEQSLRHLVIKRKKSFGCKTPKGADVMSIIYSVVMSLWWRSKKNFLRAYGEALS